MASDTPEKTLNVQRLPKDGKAISLVADGPILDALTSNSTAQEVLSFEANLNIKPWKQAGAALTGKIKAHIAQECVASLAPMETHLEFDFQRLFLPDDDPVFTSETVLDGELLLEPDGDDMPDILEGSTIEIWEVVLEELNLHIDPFPRKSEFAGHEELSQGEDGDEDTVKPFAGLKALISKKNPQQD